MRKWWKTAWMEATGPLDTGIAYGIDGHLVRLLKVVVLLALWRMVFEQKGEVAGLTVNAVLTYTLMASVFDDQLNIWSKVTDAFWQGNIAVHFARPMGLFPQFMAQTMGAWIMPFVVYSIPVFLAAPLLGVNAAAANAAAGMWFLPSLLLAISAGFAIDFIYASLMVAFGHSIWIVGQVRSTVSMLLSGALIPLALFPWNVGKIFEWLPFAATASAPLRIYTGSGEVGPLLAMQLAWNVVLWWAAGRLWAVYRERIACHGG